MVLLAERVQRDGAQLQARVCGLVWLGPIVSVLSTYDGEIITKAIRVGTGPFLSQSIFFSISVMLLVELRGGKKGGIGFTLLLFTSNSRESLQTWSQSCKSRRRK